MAVDLVIHGASGRMGQAVLRAALSEPGVRVRTALVRPGSGLADEPIGRVLGAAVPSDLKFVSALDPEIVRGVLIDFSGSHAFDSALALAQERGLALVSGTTGLSDAQFDAIADASRRIPILWSANFSLGVAMLTLLAKQAAAALAHWDCEIIEAHHSRKEDAPSGTALSLGRAIAAARGTDLHATAVHGRHGRPGARRAGEIGFSVIRAGDIVGEHTVLLATSGERIELTHRAQNRDIFARGAIEAAMWIAGQPVGAYALDAMLAARA